MKDISNLTQEEQAATITTYLICEVLKKLPLISG